MLEKAFIAWPGWKHLYYACQLAFLNTLWFQFVYFGSDYITAHRKYRVPVHFNWELRIPLVPEMILFYMSIYGLFLMAPFILRTKREIRQLVLAQALSILIAGICFLLFPAELAFSPSQSGNGIISSIFHFADQVNLDYNLLPSLHVTLSLICVIFLTKTANFFWKSILWFWGLGIAISTVLTHQHHVLDVVTGFILTFATVRCVCIQKIPGVQKAIVSN
jgi:membrane-associated phospholipid phosphatase